jgi:hypothetical protein
MNREFIPYEQAIELKELGFDEECLAIYNINEELETGYYQNKYVIAAPLYQQAFRWFREKYDLFISIMHYENGYSINDLRRFDIYEEAELACLKNLIEIVNTKEK